MAALSAHVLFAKPVPTFAGHAVRRTPVTAAPRRGKLSGRNVTGERAMSGRIRTTMFAGALVALMAGAAPACAQSIVPDLEQEIRLRAAAIEDRLIAWRRDIHEHPELGEQETRTAGLVAEHLR